MTGTCWSCCYAWSQPSTYAYYSAQTETGYCLVIYDASDLDLSLSISLWRRRRVRYVSGGDTDPGTCPGYEPIFDQIRLAHERLTEAIGRLESP